MNENKNEMNMETANFKDKRRYKYGSISVAFTVVFIALVIVLNLVLSSFSLKGDLTVDLTSEEFTVVSEQSIAILDELGKDLDATIYFMLPRDKFDAVADQNGDGVNDNDFNGVNIMALCRDIAESYTRIYDGSGDRGTVRVEYMQLDTNPAFEKKYLDESGTSLSDTSVIIQGKYHYRILSLYAFFTFDTSSGDPTAFLGESNLTSALVRSSVAEKQVVSFTRGNGEAIKDDGSFDTSSNIVNLAALYQNAGYEIKTVNLLYEDIDPNTEILISFGPTSDFHSDAIKKLTEYVNARNSFMVFVDSTTEHLTELQEFLNYNWGIGYKANHLVTDSTHSVGGNSMAVKATYPEISSELQNYSAAYQIHKTAKEKFSDLNTVLPNAVELEIMESNTQDGFTVEPILTTYDTAISVKGDETVTEGKSSPLALISSKRGYGENNANVYSYVMLVGSTDFANSQYLNSYGNKYIALAAARIFSSQSVELDILGKEFSSSALVIENGTAKTLTWVICTVIPGIIMVLGVVMFFRRRHM